MTPCAFIIEGSGNRFVAIIDTMDSFGQRSGYLRRTVIDLLSSCDARADSLLVLTPSSRASFAMRILEKDGSESTMCGNGLRASALLMSRLSRAEIPARFTIETRAGLHESTVHSEDDIAVTLGRCTLRGAMSIGGRTMYIGDVGEPHACVFGDIDDAEFHRLGELLSSDRSPIGIVNFNVVCVQDGVVSVRTFERGVRAETRSCGTGSVVSAFVARRMFHELPKVIPVRTQGGMLLVDTDATILRGSARVLGPARVPLSVSQAYAYACR